MLLFDVRESFDFISRQICDLRFDQKSQNFQLVGPLSDNIFCDQSIRTSLRFT